MIRAAMLGGVLLFGAVCWYLFRQRGGSAMPGVSAAGLAPLRVVVPVLGFVALVVAILIRLVVARTVDEAKRNSLRIIAWAVGEGAALAGGVYFFELGDPKPYLIGVTAMLATMVVVPIRDV
jgi:hypothetical protein